MCSGRILCSTESIIFRRRGSRLGSITTTDSIEGWLIYICIFITMVQLHILLGMIFDLYCPENGPFIECGGDAGYIHE